MGRYTSAFAVIFAFVAATAPAVAKDPGVLLTVHAEQESGSNKLHITGHGPLSTPVIVHVAGWISRDLPEIPLGEGDGYSQLTTDGSGNFSTTVSLATDNWEGSLVHVEASIPNRALHAQTDFHIGAESDGIQSKADSIPNR